MSDQSTCVAAKFVIWVALCCCAVGAWREAPALGAENGGNPATGDAATSADTTASEPANSTTQQGASASEDAASLIDRLGDDVFADRESATKQLIQKGISIKPLLMAALDSSDAEVRMRARHVLDVVVAADRKQRLLAFRSDDDGKLQTTLPGWDEFKKVAGDGRTARQVFVEMTQAESDLLEAYGQGPKQAAETLRQRCAVPALQPARNGIRIGNMKLSDGSMMAMIFVAGDPSVPLNDETTGSLMSMPPYMEILAIRGLAASDPRRDADLKVIGHWVARDVGAKYLLKRLALAVHFNLKEGLAPAITAIEQPQASAPAKCEALKLIAKFGGPEQIGLVEPLLHDTQPCFDSGGNTQPTQAQIRDFALVTMIRLNGQDPKDFGFAGVDWISGVDINPNLVAFKSEHDRTAAFLKWQIWQKGQKQATRERSVDGSSRE